MEYLIGSVRVHRRKDFGDIPQVFIDEFAQPFVVLFRTLYIELIARCTESVLGIDDHQTDLVLVGCRYWDVMLFAVLGCVCFQCLVSDFEHVTSFARIEVFWNVKWCVRHDLVFFCYEWLVCKKIFYRAYLLYGPRMCLMMFFVYFVTRSWIFCLVMTYNPLLFTSSCIPSCR